MLLLLLLRSPRDLILLLRPTLLTGERRLLEVEPVVVLTEWVSAVVSAMLLVTLGVLIDVLRSVFLTCAFWDAVSQSDSLLPLASSMLEASEFLVAFSGTFLALSLIPI